MFPFPAILTLWDSQVHVCSSYCGNKAFHIEVSVDYFSHIGTILYVPYVNPDDGHIRFRWDLDNSGFGSKNYIIKDIIGFKYAFNFIRWNLYIWMFTNVWDTYNLEVWFGLWKSWRGDLVCVRHKRILYIFLNLLKIERTSYIVGCDYDSFVFYMNEISNNVWFNTFESMINVNNVHAQIF